MKLWDLFKQEDAGDLRIHLGKSSDPVWTDYHFGDESRPE